MNGYMNTSKSVEWTTPDDLYQKLNDEYHFNLDPCATDDNHKCDKYYTLLENGLIQNWGGRECSAIPLMESNLQHGSARPMRRVANLIR